MSEWDRLLKGSVSRLFIPDFSLSFVSGFKSTRNFTASGCSLISKHQTSSRLTNLLLGSAEGHGVPRKLIYASVLMHEMCYATEKMRIGPSDSHYRM